MDETATDTMPQQGSTTHVPYPAWTDLMRQIGEARSKAPESAPPSRGWQDLVADMIIAPPK